MDVELEQDSSYDSIRSLNRREKLAKAAIVMSGLFASSGIVETSMADSNSIAKAEVQTSRPTPEQMPGSHIDVSRETMQRLKQSENVLVFGSQRMNRFDVEGSTAFKIVFRHEHRDMTASHGLNGFTAGRDGSSAGVFKIPGFKALDFYNPNIVDVASADPYIPYKERLTEPTDVATSIVMSTDNKDFAVISFRPKTHDISSRARSFDQLVAIDYTHQAQLSKKLERGQWVALGGVSKPSGYKQNIVKGRYVGTTNLDADHRLRLIQWVAVDTKELPPNSIGDGISGSPFLADVRGGIYGSGPLTELVHKPGTLGHQPYDTEISQQIVWQRLQNGLHANLSSASVMLGYQVLGDSLPDMINASGHSAFSTPLGGSLPKNP